MDNSSNNINNHNNNDNDNNSNSNDHNDSSNNNNNNKTSAREVEGLRASAKLAAAPACRSAGSSPGSPVVHAPCILCIYIYIERERHR